MMKFYRKKYTALIIVAFMRKHNELGGFPIISVMGATTIFVIWGMILG
jgi:hypothetical protein